MGVPAPTTAQVQDPGLFWKGDLAGQFFDKGLGFGQIAVVVKGLVVRAVKPVVEPIRVGHPVGRGGGGGRI